MDLPIGNISARPPKGADGRKKEGCFMKTLKTLGFVVLSAAIVLGILACEPPPEDTDPFYDGDVSISGPNHPNYYVGDELTVSRIGGGGNTVVDFFWYKVNNVEDIDDLVTSNTNKYTPEEIGTYYVIARGKGEDDDKEQESDKVTVTLPSASGDILPANSDFLGTWIMDGSGWNSTTDKYTETIVITRNSVKLDTPNVGYQDTQAVSATNPYTIATLKSAGKGWTPADHDYTKPYEHVYWKILTSTALTDTTQVSAGSQTNSPRFDGKTSGTYTVGPGLSLVVECESYKGYVPQTTLIIRTIPGGVTTGSGANVTTLPAITVRLGSDPSIQGNTGWRWRTFALVTTPAAAQ